jgi:hypothetical protein
MLYGHHSYLQYFRTCLYYAKLGINLTAANSDEFSNKQTKDSRIPVFLYDYLNSL